MNPSTLARPETIKLGSQMPKDDYRFFDPRSPAQPEQIFGVDTEAVLRLGSAVIDLGVLPPRINIGIHALPNVVRLVPLVEEMQAGVPLNPEDIRPYRKPIKKVIKKIGFAERPVVTAAAVVLSVPFRRYVNRKIERELPARSADAIDKARKTIANLEGLESDIDYLASFENPQEQFVSELSNLAQTVSSNITEQRDWRVQNNVPAQAEAEVPKGIMGFFTKVVRKVRSLFGFFSRQPAVNTEITAYDAGVGIEKTIRHIIENRYAAEKQLPMLSKLLLERLPTNLPHNKDRLALLAPEILNFLFSALPKDDTISNLLDSVNRNPHELRFVTKYKKSYRPKTPDFAPRPRYYLYKIQRASVNLLPAIRDVLPTNGAKLREIFDHIQDLLQNFQTPADPDQNITQSVSNKTPSNKFRNRLSNIFRSRRTI